MIPPEIMEALRARKERELMKDKIVQKLTATGDLLTAIDEMLALKEDHAAKGAAFEAVDATVRTAAQKIFELASVAFGYKDADAVHEDNKYVGFDVKTKEVHLKARSERGNADEEEDGDDEAKKTVVRAMPLPEAAHGLRARTMEMSERQEEIRAEAKKLDKEHQDLFEESKPIEKEFWEEIAKGFGFATCDAAHDAGMSFQVAEDLTTVTMFHEDDEQTKASAASAASKN